MNLYYSNSYTDDEGVIEEIKSALIYASKEDLLEICDFFEKVKDHLKNYENCHMHLCDHKKGWKKGRDFDLEVNLVEE